MPDHASVVAKKKGRFSSFALGVGFLVVATCVIAVTSFLWYKYPQQAAAVDEEPLAHATVLEKASSNNKQQNQEGQKIRASTSRIPNFLLAGTQKAGTTYLNWYLINNTNFCHPIHNAAGTNNVKEVHFFNHNETFVQGVPLYQKLFEHCDQNVQYIIDSTPNYMAYPERVYSVYKEQGLVDKVKIVFSLREPVSREISFYDHMVDRVNKSWAQVIRKNPDDGTLFTFEQYVNNTLLNATAPDKEEEEDQKKEDSDEPEQPYPFTLSKYAPLLERWFDLFDRQNILILSFDELQTDRGSVFRRIQQFLGLANPIQFLNTTKHSHPHVATLSCAFLKEFAATFEPYNERLYTLLHEHPGPEMEQKPFPKFSLPPCDGSS